MELRLLRRDERRLDFLPDLRLLDLRLAERLRLEDLLLAERLLAERLERLLFGAILYKVNDLGEQEQTNQEQMISTDDFILKHDNTVEMSGIERDCDSL